MVQQWDRKQHTNVICYKVSEFFHMWLKVIDVGSFGNKTPQPIPSHLHCSTPS